MSYILDALRRAEAERERGAVPGLHSQPNLPSTPAAAASRRPAWIGGAAAVGMLAAGAALWWFTSAGAGPGADTRVSAAMPPAGREPPPGGVKPAAPEPKPAAKADAPPPATRQPPPAPALPAGERPRAAPVARPAAPPRPAAVVEAGPARANRTVPVPQPDTPATPGAGRAVPYEQLPAEVRRVLPTLAIGGAIYSEQPSARLLLVGGQLLHEGDNAAAGVTLEHIGQRSAVLRWRDLRYEVAY